LLHIDEKTNDIFKILKEYASSVEEEAFSLILSDPHRADNYFTQYFGILGAIEFLENKLNGEKK
jgi:hypothetical protein